ncbi:hypothetical protein [Actinoplanes sp. NPDC020271]|uniref:hypothetical protein n=1 Tax=Actinoplanes sp. NPDC020271 TaxID=3363896 RepID=UPI0037B605EF
MVGAAPTAVSQHLAKLRLAGIVKGRREGTNIHYSVGDAHTKALLAAAPIASRPGHPARQQR